jgi:tetratricopeptide (TPR) repeat protein
LEEYAAAIDPLTTFADMRDDLDTAGSDLMLETAYYFLGESYLFTEQPEMAANVLGKAILIDRTDADALYRLGQAHLALEQPEEALPYLERAVRLVPDFVEVYTEMINAYAALDDADYVAYARGMQAFSKGDFQTALIHLQAASEALPDFGPALVGLGLAYEKMEQYPEALAAIEYALELDPTDLVAQQAYGRLQATIEEQNN